MFLLPVPSMPQDLVYVSSTKNSMMLSWKQSGAVDNYTVAHNNTVTSSVKFSGVGEVDVSVTVSDLPTSGAYYCIKVTAVSGHLLSDSVTQCNYTGEFLSFCNAMLCLCHHAVFVCPCMCLCVCHIVNFVKMSNRIFKNFKNFKN